MLSFRWIQIRFKSSEMWQCVTAYTHSDILKDCSAFTIRVQQSMELLVTLLLFLHHSSWKIIRTYRFKPWHVKLCRMVNSYWHFRGVCCYQHPGIAIQEQFTHQKTWTSIKTAIRTSYNAQLSFTVNVMSVYFILHNYITNNDQGTVMRSM